MNPRPRPTSAQVPNTFPVRCPHCGGKIAEWCGPKLTIKRSGLQAEVVADNGRVTFTCHWPRCQRKFIEQLSSRAS